MLQFKLNLSKLSKMNLSTNIEYKVGLVVVEVSGMVHIKIWLVKYQLENYQLNINLLIKYLRNKF